jgi:hypothetical protein
MMKFPLHRVARTCCLVLVAFATLASCNKSETKPPAHVPFAYVQKECGPTDGINLTFYFTQKPSEDGTYEEPYIEISISEDSTPPAPRDYTITPSKHDVFAFRCTTNAKCDAAVSGNLHLSTQGVRKNISGEYELHFQDGAVESRAFDANWVILKLPLLCG